MNTCRTCRWYENISHSYGGHEACHHPRVRYVDKIDPVSGELVRANSDSCYFARTEVGPCGPEGRYWEKQKPEPTLYYRIRRWFTGKRWYEW